MKWFFIKVNIVVLVLLLSACGGDGGGDEDEASPQNRPTDSQPDDQVTNEPPAVLLIKSATPSSGFAGGSVTLTVEGADSSTVAIFNGVEIAPSAINEVDQTITFSIPDNASSGSLKITTNEFSSNAIWFTVGKIETGVIAPVDGVIAPIEGETATDGLGNTVAIAYLLVGFAEENDTREQADSLAALVSGEVVGRISLVNGWQIKVNASSLENLQLIISEILKPESAVAYTVIDVEIQPDASDDVINWSNDPDRPSQRSRNNVEEGVALYKNEVSPTANRRVRPSFMSIGISEPGVDYKKADFSGYASDANNFSGNVVLYANQQDSATRKHGSNVVGVIAAELGDKGNAGPISALNKVHGGAIIRVGTDAGLWALSLLSQTEQHIRAGAQVINWSWGVRKEGAIDCSGASVVGDSLDVDMFTDYASMMNRFFSNLKKEYPNVVIVTSAGNDATNAGDNNFRLPASIVSDQLLVVGAHTTKGSIKLATETLVEDDWAASKSATSCYDTTIKTDVKRADYSNYGNRVDIVASGSIIGLDNDADIMAHDASYENWGTSYAAPLVTATVALMQSINPNLTPAEIKSFIRQSALPIENKVVLKNAPDETVTRALSAEESSGFKGQGARLNVKDAIQQALDSLDEETLSVARPPVTITLEPESTEVTETISVTIPSSGWIYDKVDIMFLVDVSFSYADDLKVFRDKADDLIDAFSESGADVKIGLSSFSDFPEAPYGAASDYEYKLDQGLTYNYVDFKNALEGLSLLSGGDLPESQLEALFQTNQAETDWREEALPIIFLATDAAFHNPGEESSYKGKNKVETLAALKTRGTRVFGLQSGGAVADVIDIAKETGGQAFILSQDSKEIVEVVRTALASAVITDISAVLQPKGDFAGLVKSITPSEVDNAQPGDSFPNVNSQDTIKFDVVFSRGTFTAGTARTFSFRLRVIAENVAVIQDIPVTVILK